MQCDLVCCSAVWCCSGELGTCRTQRGCRTPTRTLRRPPPRSQPHPSIPRFRPQHESALVFPYPLLAISTHPDTLLPALFRCFGRIWDRGGRTSFLSSDGLVTNRALGWARQRGWVWDAVGGGPLCKHRHALAAQSFPGSGPTSPLPPSRVTH